MSARKRFDALQMKHAIQTKLQRQYARMTDDQRLAAIEQQLAHTDSPVGRLWRDLKNRHNPICQVAETPAQYASKRKPSRSKRA